MPDMANEIFSPIALRLARASAKLTLTDLSKPSGVAYQQINRYEKGKVVPRDTTVVKLANALEIDPMELYTEAQDS